MTDQQSPEWADDLNKKLTRLIRLTDRQNRLLSFTRLGPDPIVTLNHLGEAFRMYVPFGDQDYIQGALVAKRDFYESELLATLRTLNIVPKGSVVIDAGANIGNHSVYFQHFLAPKRLYSFEPQPLAYDTLVRNIGLNDSPCETRPVRAMLGAEEGTGAVSTYKTGNQGAATFAPTEGGGTPMVTLDSALEDGDHDNVGFIKIDVEGFQGQVLRGAHNILTRSKPPLWIEVFAEEKAETDDILAAYGYRSTPLAGTRNNHLYQVG